MVSTSQHRVAREIVPELTTPEDLDMRIARLATVEEPGVELESPASADDSFTSDVRDLANQPPVVRFVSLLIREAYDAGASDIHIESTRGGLTTGSASTACCSRDRPARQYGSRGDLARQAPR